MAVSDEAFAALVARVADLETLAKALIEYASPDELAREMVPFADEIKQQLEASGDIAQAK